MGQPTTRLQISGHRFLARRMEHALVRGDTRMLDDPLRGQSLSLCAGAVLAVIVVAVCAVLAFVRPGGALGDAPVVVVRETGATYVRIDGVLHPVANLASARLIVGAPAEPAMVSKKAVDRAARGPQVGILGAPEDISPPLRAEEAGWTVCDDDRGATTVIGGRLPDAVGVAGRSVLVTPRDGPAAVTYLLHGAWRSRVDLRHPAVVRALRLDGVVPREVSQVLLAAIPEAPAIAPPRIPGLGAPGPGRLNDHPVGTVVTVARADRATDDLFVVLPDGLQRIGEVAADLIRYTDARAGAQIPAVPAEVVGSVPVVTSLPVATFPPRGGVVDEPVVCAVWRQDRGGTGSRTALLVDTSLPRTAAALTLAQQDGGGPAVDAVAVPPGRSMFVRSVGLTGDGASAGSLFLVTVSGVRHGVRDGSSAAALGLGEPAVPAPWPVLAALPRGPELSREAASAIRDGVAAAP
ncbi:type VII secretion protein EccB [Mycolicibacterium iranicum]|uniref:Type VII secretion protein EccB n=1 Tax=Mycolicibacterium iranicum TaxID=912594 RepID=A0A839Q182_MYCIR|nr:type VII secretion protein EccB [Mycolicibacterium iranicum]MBB2989930.1 type VII secretion protein EccB [Mycolicibacterium iranicum]